MTQEKKIAEALADMKTQEEKFAEVLMGLNREITTADRKAASENLEIAYHTLIRYLAGKVSDCDTAIKIIDFLHEKITNRERKLEEYKTFFNTPTV